MRIAVHHGFHPRLPSSDTKPVPSSVGTQETVLQGQNDPLTIWVFPKIMVPPIHPF